MAPRQRPLNLRKLMFVLPNLFTVSSIFCGIYSLTLSSGEATGEQLYKAALAIFFGIFFDGFDGRVARLTKTQSDFGMELDSLADVVTFGVAPALLVFKWALSPLGTLGIVVACVYASCGALRLARFNVLAHRSPGGSSRFFIGLPIPFAAGTLVSLVIAHHGVGASAQDVMGNVPIMAVVLVISYLMVSNIRYRTFKDARLSPRSALLFLVVIASGVIVSMRSRPSSVLIAYFTAYILLGMAEEIIFFRKRRDAERAANVPEVEEPVLPAEEDEEAEDEDAEEPDGSGFV